MKKVLKVLFILIILVFSFKSSVLSVSNNKFGIHITHEADLENAAELVNSNGGDWGYVTIVIQDTDLDKDKWQDFFDQCREKHLIPLVRLATHPEGENWVKPSNDLILQYSNFLDSLNWPIKTRYIIVFNEPNHTKEWGGIVNPKEYAQILNQSITLFKQKNPDFYILNAGMDQAAGNSLTTMDETKFLREMNFEVPLIFERLDGWSSHSYPNHGFVGKPWESGKASVSGYKWELSYLKILGNRKELPVFITETGWPHTMSEKLKVKSEKFYTPKIGAEYLKYAFENVWLKDNNIVAVTPFILNYPQEPFDHFSWINLSGEKYPQYDEILNMTKINGEPLQIEKIEPEGFFYPIFAPANFNFSGKITLTNKGQSIWGEKPFVIKAITNGVGLSDLALPDNVLVKPGAEYSFDFTLSTNSIPGDYIFGWENLGEHKIKVFEVWKISNKTKSETLTFPQLLWQRILDIFKK